MNDVLHLIGQLKSKGSHGRPGAAKIPTRTFLLAEKMSRLVAELELVADFWERNTFGIVPLVRVRYISVVAKSNRISRLLLDSQNDINSQIAGAEFTGEDNPRHIVTYRVSLPAIKDSLSKLRVAEDIVRNKFQGKVTSDDIEVINKGRIDLGNSELSRSAFTGIIKDCFYADSFSIKDSSDNPDDVDNLIVTIYDTGLSYQELLLKIGGGFHPSDKMDDLTWLLNPKQYQMLREKAPFLISMTMSDLNEYARKEKHQPLSMGFDIPKPSSEPVIGVIDTLFAEDVYFSEWVEYHQILPPDLAGKDDYDHGTQVSSIIVDGPNLNKGLDDGCGRFRVRHFGVAKSGKMSSFSIIREIKDIVISNPDIKVWNLSLGSDYQISKNFISPEAAMLDELQYRYDVIFVIAGTNNRSGDGSNPYIGAPADSINAITVNSVDLAGQPVSYARRGPVLRFFNKPDVSVFGGTKLDTIKAYGPLGPVNVLGTSYAAPWISRKLAYLIHVMGMTKEAAKALLIDSAAGWDNDIKNIALIGYGCVPMRIEDIIRCKDDEIRFFINGNILDYDTYTSDIPVPNTGRGFPYRFRVTLCYTPRCHRNQGVDYTDTELNILFGRFRSNGSMNSINNNQQGEPLYLDLPEGKARTLFRKWDNVKHISEGISERARMKKMKSNDDIFWGFSIKSIERLADKPGRGMPFGIVVTMKAIDKQNRADQFVKLCNITHKWTAIPLNQEVMADLYDKAEAEVEFDI